MTKEFKLFLKLFTASARGDTVILDDDNYDFKKLINISTSQSVFPMIFEALKKSGIKEKKLIPEDILTKLERTNFSYIIQGENKCSYTGRAISLLNDNGIDYCLLKGISLSRFYAIPALRISSDTDIYVGKKNEVKAYTLLETLGYQTQFRSKTSHHTRCTHPTGGLIELHLSFYDEIFEDLWFENIVSVTESFITFSDSYGNNIQTLGINDGFIYACLHCIKHFLTEGVGIRQIMDIILYAEHYENEINWDSFSDKMKRLKFDGFMDVCFEIGRKYLGSDFSRSISGISFQPGLIEEILNDIEDGGVFGNDDSLRKDFYYHYTILTHKNKQADNYINKWSKQSKFSLLFPSYGEMCYNYKYIRRFPLLLPVAWTHRLIKFILKISENQNIKTYSRIIRNTEQNEQISHRIELLNKIRMI